MGAGFPHHCRLPLHPHRAPRHRPSGRSPQTQTSLCRGPERAGRESCDCEEFQRRAEPEPGFHGLVEQSDDTRGSLHSNYPGNGQGAGSGWGDLGWGLRLCISNTPAGSEGHRGTERKADPSQQAGCAWEPGRSPGRELADGDWPGPQALSASFPRGRNANCIYSLTQLHWVTETTSKELPVKSPKR